MEIQKYQEKIFEDIKHVNVAGEEYWEARELMKVLGYSKWSNFKKVIDKAKISCKLSGYNVDDCFADVGKPIISAKESVKL